MKNALFSLLGLAAIFMVAACGSETKPTDATSTPTVAVTTADGELWGEHVRSQAEIIKPEDWDSSDWARVNKFVDQQKIAHVDTGSQYSFWRELLNHKGVGAKAWC